MDRKYINSTDYMYQPIALYDLLQEVNSILGDIYDKIEENDNTNPQIKIKYHNPDMPKLKQTKIGNWIDLYTSEEITLKAGEFKIISLGISMKLPEGYESNIVSRSSTFKHWGVLQSNAYGVVDESYSGNNDIWGYPCYATKDVTIPAFTRLCQFRINKIMPQVEFEEVDYLRYDNRHGFGSTGR